MSADQVERPVMIASEPADKGPRVSITTLAPGTGIRFQL